jgi:hypothetical protein
VLFAERIETNRGMVVTGGLGTPLRLGMLRYSTTRGYSTTGYGKNINFRNTSLVE